MPSVLMIAISSWICPASGIERIAVGGLDLRIGALEVHVAVERKRLVGQPT